MSNRFTNIKFSGMFVKITFRGNLSTFLQKAVDVMHIDCDHHDHQNYKQLIHTRFLQPFIYRTPTDSSCNATRHHENQNRRCEFRHVSCEACLKQTGQLREENHIQGIFCRRLGTHGEEKIKHHQVDGPSADSKKRRKQP